MSKTFDYCNEIRGISAVLIAMHNAVESGADNLSDATLMDFYFGLSSHLSRIADDLENLDSADKAAE